LNSKFLVLERRIGLVVEPAELLEGFGVMEFFGDDPLVGFFGAGVLQGVRLALSFGYRGTEME
jgi:hypothetical protein